MDFYPKNKIPVDDVKKFVVIFYFVGFLGFIIPFTRAFFITITPFALLLNAYLLVVNHKNFTLKTLLVFILILVSGFVIEVIGVKTGKIFGNYSYGETLGIKLFETPLLIGLNWLLLAYTAATLSQNLKLMSWLSVFISPLFMVLYDVVLEQVAPKMKMWSWENSEIPFKNYLAWYIIALGFVLLLKVFKIETQNPLGAIIFISQFMFFLLIYLFS
ncbi:MAG: carotenoid biosynthesis protein [Candidatus Kapaibacteriales bacterium]